MSLNLLRLVVGCLVVRESDSRPESLGSMPDATKYPPSTHGFHLCHLYKYAVAFPTKIEGTRHRGRPPTHNHHYTTTYATTTTRPPTTTTTRPPFEHVRRCSKGPQTNGNQPMESHRD
ncbi:hypothetical protein TNCV_139181 [Trichonephila clavipes]|nr:hypothetical protein TNCV_139181 [Trichonephila clavipes]